MSNVSFLTDRTSDRWIQLGSKKDNYPIRKKLITTDVVVIGGGMAGICAAVSAARNGSKVVLVQDRPVLGGNASSEIRVIVHGVTKLKSGLPERETGIIEEVLLRNRFYNEQNSYTVWDHVLYDFVTMESNISLLMNTQAIRAHTKNNKIIAATCWQLTTETIITLNAKIFIDCSGDGLLAATAGAKYRTGREASSEFKEKYAPKEADGWQMGATILLSSKDMGKPTKFKAPHYTIKFEAEKSHPDRKILPFVEGFWWVEIGSNNDIIGSAEIDRHKLMGYAYGVWDYVKNSGKYPEADNYSLDWVGSLPGRRESRRFIGDYILSEGDLLNNKYFVDAVGFGGWPLDEHNPGGIENLTHPPSYWHEHFENVYAIPLRSLYSKNIENLMFAGRNISQTHVALSSTRVMGTCSTMGQAVGTAAAICIEKNIVPRILKQKYINVLQEQLLRDDAYIPNRPAKDPLNLFKIACSIIPSSTNQGDVKLLTDGFNRDENGNIHHWQSTNVPAEIIVEWENHVTISTIEVICDTDVKKNIMMLKNPRENNAYTSKIPSCLIKSLVVQILLNDKWKEICSIDENQRRLIKFKFGLVATKAMKIKIQETYGAESVKIFGLRCYN